MTISVRHIGYMHDYELYSTEKYKSPLSVIKFKEKTYRVLVAGTTFNKFTKKEKDVLFYHEMGHIECKHDMTIGYRNIENEYQADMYSVEKCGFDIVIKTLKKSATIPEFQSERVLEEIKLRLEYLDSMKRKAYD